NHGPLLLVVGNASAYDRAVTPKAPLPDLPAQHRHRRSVPKILVRPKGAAQGRPDPQDIEHVGGDRDGGNLGEGSVAIGQHATRATPGSHRRKAPGSLP